MNFQQKIYHFPIQRVLLVFWLHSFAIAGFAQVKTWTKRTNLPGPRAALTCSSVNGKIYVIGGTRIAPPPHPGVSTVEEFIPSKK